LPLSPVSPRRVCCWGLRPAGRSSDPPLRRRWGLSSAPVATLLILLLGTPTRVARASRWHPCRVSAVVAQLGGQVRQYVVLFSFSLSWLLLGSLAPTGPSRGRRHRMHVAAPGVRCIGTARASMPRWRRRPPVPVLSPRSRRGAAREVPPPPQGPAHAAHRLDASACAACLAPAPASPSSCSLSPWRRSGRPYSGGGMADVADGICPSVLSLLKSRRGSSRSLFLSAWCRRAGAGRASLP
jgi:hypothetical protein